MEIVTKQPVTKAPADTLTGDAWFDVIAKGEQPSRMRVNVVRFAPGAHNAWHRHAVGQTLHVTEGLGLIQSRGGEVTEIRPGDTVHTPPRRMALARRRSRPLHNPHRHVGSTRRRPRNPVGRPRHQRRVRIAVATIMTALPVGRVGRVGDAMLLD